MLLRTVLGISSFAIARGSGFIRVDGENAVASGARKKAASVDACEATCIKDCVQYSWSKKTRHCYTSASTVWITTDNDRIESGCIPAKVDGCPGAPPGPTPPPSPPTPPAPPSPPTPGGMPPFNSIWFRSDATKVNITYPIDSEKGKVFRWTKPTKPTVALTYFSKAAPLDKVGDAFRIKIGWRSDGQNKCDPYDWQDGRTCSCGQDIKETCAAGKGTPSCARTSVNCLEGTGDFRIALWDTVSASATHEKNDNFAPGASGDQLHAYMDQIGAGYRGYQFRTMPHTATTYHHPKATEPGGFFAKQVGSTDPFDDHRLPGHWGDQNSGVFPGFYVPNGKWSYLDLGVARTAARTYALSIEMHGQRYNYTHTWDADSTDAMPQCIDAFGIWFPNSRNYDYVEFSADHTNSIFI